MKHFRKPPTILDDQPRSGAATVEFAILMPLFLTLVLGTVEMGSAINASHTLYGALRDGGRLASMDYKGIIPTGTNVNTKITQDVKNILQASGIPPAQVTVNIVHAGGASDGQPFNLNDPANDLKLFRIEADVPYEAVSTFPLSVMAGETLHSELTFRKGRVTLSSG